MKKFRFRLEALLKYRAHLEQLAKEEVARIQTEINKCNERIRDLRGKQMATVQKTEEKMVEGLSARDHQIYLEYIRSLGMKITEEEELVEKLNTILVGKQEELTKKSISKKVLANLKEKQKQDYYDEIDKLMMKEADEMVLLKRFFNENQ